MALQQVCGQAAPLKGVVWDVPASPQQAERDLQQMHRIGIEAVRTGLIEQEGLLNLADTLGIQFFQELPLDYVPAASLADTLNYAARMLSLALARANTHPSARHFGLARHSDTSNPVACAFFEQLAQRVQQEGPPGSRVYYLTPFVTSDRCAGAVDFVLLDVLDAEAPVARLAQWRAAQDTLGRTPAGIGALGTWVGACAASGVQHRHSAESQARYLETHLTALLDTTATDSSITLPALFVHTWRDVQRALPTPRLDLARPYVESYGLYTLDDTPRPAFETVSGLYAGTQTAFALPAGAPPMPPPSWTLLLGWGVFVLLGGCYALSPQFRYMVPRYFQAHGFYREAVREGRDLVLGAIFALLLGVSLSAGVLGAGVLEVLRSEAAFGVLLGWANAAVQATLIGLLARPWLLVILLACIYALGVVLWATLLMIAAHRRYRLAPGQALVLVVWPNWLLLPLMVGAMVAMGLEHTMALKLALVLIGAAVLAMLYGVLRTLVDYRGVTNTPSQQLIGLALASPPVFILVVGFFVALEIGLPLLTLVWNLLWLA